jgi:hypothetical protein
MVVPAPPRRTRQVPRRQEMGAAWKIMISLLVVVLLFAVMVCGVTGAYAAVATRLPSPEELRARSASFVSTQIMDRDGHLLYEILDPNGGRFRPTSSMPRWQPKTAAFGSMREWISSASPVP